MMAWIVTTYKTPRDVAAFDVGYFEQHVPMVRKIRGIRHYAVSRGPVVTPAGPSDIHLVTMLQFDDLAAIRRAFASPEGQAASAHVKTFATGGAEMLFFESREI